MGITWRQRYWIVLLCAALGAASLWGGSSAAEPDPSGMPAEYADAAKLERAEQVFRIVHGYAGDPTVTSLREPVK